MAGWRVYLGIFLLAGTGMQQAEAHPHSFISLQTTPIVDNNQLIGLKMRWKMDELTSADLLYDAGMAKPGSEVWKTLAAEVMANVLSQHYFTELWHNGNKVKFSATPSQYSLERENHQAVLRFILPLATPQPLKGETYQFSTFDPSYYVDMQYDAGNDLVLPPELEKHCQFSLHTPSPGEEIRRFALSLDKADAPEEDMELGKQFAQQVRLTCH